MYLDFYGLHKEPFNITPDPEFLYLSESHKGALGSIIYGIEKKKGFVAITGGVGVGKTMIVRSYLEQTRDSGLKAVYVFNPNLSFKGLLKLMYQELGLTMPRSGDPVDLVFRLYVGIVKEFKEGNTVALIVDEAQNMPIETLENLRMLSNLETIKEKLIQIVLVGQPEFDRILDKPELKQLQQRISVRTSIAPLSREESAAYIQHRLVTAGLMDRQIFDDGALKLIIREAQGIPRSINILCDSALVTGCGYGKKPVTRAIVKEVITDFQGTKKSENVLRLFGFRFQWRRALTFASVAALVILAVFFGGLWGRYVTNKPLTVDPARELARVTARPSPTPSAPVPARPGNGAQSEAPGPQRAASGPPSQDVAIKVRKGDTLSSLIRQAYGENQLKQYGAAALLGAVMKRNAVKNQNQIRVGETVVFPSADSSVRQ
jgi:type II secretory pathway predicted ATPase ExeA